MTKAFKTERTLDLKSIARVAHVAPDLSNRDQLSIDGAPGAIKLFSNFRVCETSESHQSDLTIGFIRQSLQEFFASRFELDNLSRVFGVNDFSTKRRIAPGLAAAPLLTVMEFSSI